LQQGDGHQGSKASKVVFLGRQNRLFTTGFSRHSERQYAVWDAVSVHLLKTDSVPICCCPVCWFADCCNIVVNNMNNKRTT